MILGIESSCDESALALLDRSKGIVGEWVSSQVTLHTEYGGIVPELASREHLSNFARALRELREQYSFSGDRRNRRDGRAWAGGLFGDGYRGGQRIVHVA